MRYGMMENTDPGLANIWHMDSDPLTAALSLGVLVLMALGAFALAVRVFKRRTMAWDVRLARFWGSVRRHINDVVRGLCTQGYAERRTTPLA
jgi:hypothetical protein